MANNETARGILQLKNVRLSFPHIWQPQANKFNPAAEPKFGAALIIPKVHPQLDEVRALITSIMRDTWGAQLSNPHFLAKIEVCLRDGEEKVDKDGYGPDVMFFNAYNKKRPTIVDADRTPLTEADGRPYGGCYVNAFISFYAQKSHGRLGVNAGLEGLQFFRDGEAFGGGVRVEPDMFDDVTGAASSAPLQQGHVADFLC